MVMQIKLIVVVVIVVILAVSTGLKAPIGDFYLSQGFSALSRMSGE